MAANNRIYYAIEAVGMATLGSTSYTALHGIQSIGITTNFTLQQTSELGQVSLYANVEILPEVELTLEKKVDGYCPLWLQATKGTLSADLQARSVIRTSVALSIYGDTQRSASGVPIAEIDMSGAYPGTSSFAFTVDGTSTETLSLMGNNKTSTDVTTGGNALFTPTFANTDVPFSQTSGSGGIQRRRDMIFYPILDSGTYAGTKERGTTLDANGQLIAFLTILPPDIDGISSSGTNNRTSTGQFLSHVQDVNVSCNLQRENLFEQGRQGPYFKYPTTPIEITSDMSITAIKWDNVSALEEGTLTGLNAGFNLVNRTIKVRMREGTFIDLGTSNKLTSLNYSGGDTGGANVTIRYSYQTFSDYTVTHPQDPTAGITWPY